MYHVHLSGLGREGKLSWAGISKNTHQAILCRYWCNCVSFLEYTTQIEQIRIYSSMLDMNRVEPLSKLCAASIFVDPYRFLERNQIPFSSGFHLNPNIEDHPCEAMGATRWRCYCIMPSIEMRKRERSMWKAKKQTCHTTMHTIIRTILHSPIHFPIPSSWCVLSCEAEQNIPWYRHS